MNISLVSSTLSYNPMIRVYPFYKILSKKHNVQLIGPIDKQGFYKPLRNEIREYDGIQEKKIFPLYLKTAFDIKKRISGEVVHAFKPRIFSYGSSLLHCLKTSKKLIVDIDDWESRHFIDNYFSWNPVKLAMFLGSDGYFGEGLFGKILLEKLLPYADRIVVDCYQLQKIFGGVYIPSGADTEVFNPEKYSGKKIREKYGFKKNDVVIGYIGNPKKHKGVLEIVEAVRLAQDTHDNVKLLIVGADKNQPAPEVRKFIEGLEKVSWAVLEGYVEHEKIPEYLAAVDVIPVPHLNTAAADKQMPYKIFEAMAMGKAIIGSDKADIPLALDGCGKIIPAGNVDALKDAILDYADNKKLRLEHGEEARRKCVKEYSWKSMQKRIFGLYESV